MAEQGDRAAQARARAAAARQKIKEKENRLKEIRAHCAKHGDHVLSTVLHHFNTEGGLSKLVHRLTRRAVTDWDKQLDTLDNYITRWGEASFLRSADPRRASNAKRVSHSSPTPLVTQAELQAAVKAGRRLVRLPSGQVIIDRRSGRRRVAKDRRQSIEAIRKNQRFGGDRRRGDRRTSKPVFVDPSCAQ